MPPQRTIQHALGIDVQYQPTTSLINARVWRRENAGTHQVLWTLTQSAPTNGLVRLGMRVIAGSIFSYTINGVQLGFTISGAYLGTARVGLACGGLANSRCRFNNIYMA
jgi:hypothetical protein